MQSSARKLRGRDGTVQSPTRYFISIVRMYPFPSSPGKSPFLSSPAPRFARPCASRAMQSSARKLRGRDGTVQSPTRYFISIVRMYLSHPLREITISLLSCTTVRQAVCFPVPCSHPHASLEGETVPCSHRHVTSLVSCECTFSHPLREITISLLSCTTVRQAVCFPVPCSHPHASLEGETVPCSHRHVTSLVSCECTFPILSGEITISLLSCTTVRQAVCFPCHAVIRTQA